MSSTTAPGNLRSPQNSALQTEARAVQASQTVIAALGSLKFTCVLFILSMVIVLIGSLAQSRRDVWQVMEDYFRCYVAKIDVQDLFPPSMFGDYGTELAEKMGAFRYLPFPGGWTIGWLMLINLSVAHLTKFRIHAKGTRLLTGIGLIVAGSIMLTFIVITGNRQTGVADGITWLSAEAIWYMMLAILGLSGAAVMAAGFLNTSAGKVGRGVIVAFGVLLTGVFLYYVIGGEAARLNASSMRILWQLLKGTACSIVLLIGCNILFEKRGGIALLHLGVALLMISELQVGLIAKENMLSLIEGESSVFVRDVRERELAIVTQQDNGKDRVLVVPERLLEQAANAAASASDDNVDYTSAGGKVTDRQVLTLEGRSFGLAVRKFLRNSELRPLNTDEKVNAQKGLASFAAAESLPPVTGMEETHDESSVIVDVVDAKSGKILSTLLVSQEISELQAPGLAEAVRIDDKDHYFYLRFQRNYKPYEVRLLDVSRTNYVGSATPRDYRSIIQISDGGQTEEFTLWMNNPLRYKGETFYQSGYTPLENGKEATTLSVVRNSGWMLPYIACMIVSVGMFAQFGQTLMRFLDRTFDRTVPAPSDNATENSGLISALYRPAVPLTPAPTAAPRSPVFTVVIPSLLTLLFAIWVLMGARPPRLKEGERDLYALSQIPIAWNGRSQPLDSLARTQLLMMSHKSEFEAELESWQLSQEANRNKVISAVRGYWKDADTKALETLQGSYDKWISEIQKLSGASKEDVEARMRSVMVRKAPAVQWLMDVMTRPEVAARHRVLKIEDDQLLSLLGLEKRGGLTYSLNEVRENLEDLQNILRKAREKQRDKKEHLLEPYERRVATLFDNIGRISQLSQMFMPQDSDNALNSALDAWRILHALGSEPAVMAVPTGASDEQRSWETFVASNSLHQMNTTFLAQKISSVEDFIKYIRDTRPLEMVRASLRSNHDILLNVAATQTESGKSPGELVRERAATAMASFSDNPYMVEILRILQTADPSQTIDQIVDSITPEQASRVASERISLDLFQVISQLGEENPNDPRLAAIRGRVQSLGTQDTAALSEALSMEVSRLIWQDLQERAGHLMPGGEAHESFEKNVSAVAKILDDWRNDRIADLDISVTGYLTHLKTEETRILAELAASKAKDPDNNKESGQAEKSHISASVVRREAWFNHFDPFMKTEYVYLPVVVLTFLSWMLPARGALRNSGLYLLVLGFILHSFALYLRMVISGRPPVTNLYSSAIFIGWAVVAAACIVELILKNGIGNIVGSATGMGTLMIAHYLARDEGDTLGVMQAVLDTAFWLATHVVCITLGYAATFLAGAIGLGYCILCLTERFQGTVIHEDTGSPARTLVARMNYGVLCFALFFSLVGTVLGGLWADDSWGRFWGWDPKENGAMLIVIWNALILHARWDKLIRDYGTAILSMFGNIVTAWSWFGVNELKAGLHTYGFTEGRLYALGMFVAIQMVIIIVFLLIGDSARKSQATTAA